ncbi:GATOR complex protein DEPDC5 [Amphibalanus amphitrite]|uniref:GATOR complex protein DEPDC5 n=1 Tax=Amphibalanus amphitrite TaxID=1232801 RepID=A0A6A4WH32_AMPAM|nr:GATOR complex protein DEPDC5 [Amphibalanus amphitrite]KAF0301332.1 GATOR complex protein DEPDC5 [Amphibalanus amphitrite]
MTAEVQLKLVVHQKLQQVRGGDIISVETTLVETFHLRNQVWAHVSVRLVDPADVALDSVELLFRDHYLNRSDMWRLKLSLVGKVLHHKKSVEFCSQTVRCQVFEMWSQGDRVACGLVTPDTKVVFRSATSMFHLYIQMSEEMWDFDVYGDLYFEKAVNGFLSDLFNNWKRNNTNHEVTITLFSRLFYKASSINEFPEYMQENVQQDFRNMFYEDFYRVAVQNERYDDWTPVLSTIRHQFMGYRESLLNFHRDRAPPGAPPPPRAVLSSAAQGNFLEVLNISMNVFEKHYLHRSLERTGQMCVVVSPGVGVYQVERELNNLTKQRIIDYGVGIDLVCVGEQPLHAVPLLRFHNKGLAETQDYYLPHTWINLSFYSSNKRVGYSEFVPRIKVPPGAPKTAVSRVQSVIPRGRPPTSEHAIPSSVYDYDAHDAEVFKKPDTFKQSTMTLQRLPQRKRTVTTSQVKTSRRADSVVSSPIHEQVYSSSASGFVTPARSSPLVQSPSSASGGELLSSSFGSVFAGSDRSDGSANVRRLSFDDSDVNRSPPRPATSAVSACDLSLSRGTGTHRPGRALFNPFDPSNIVVKHTSNRRRWTHIFPKGPKGVLFQQHHYANARGLDVGGKDAPRVSSDQAMGSPSLSFLWGASSTGEQEWSAHITTGVDWKSLTTPACLPITTDYFPDERSLQKDYFLFEYSILPDDVGGCAEDVGGAHRQLTTREVFTEMVSQRLCQVTVVGADGERFVVAGPHGVHVKVPRPAGPLEVPAVQSGDALVSAGPQYLEVLVGADAAPTGPPAPPIPPRETPGTELPPGQPGPAPADSVPTPPVPDPPGETAESAPLCAAADSDDHLTTVTVSSRNGTRVHTLSGLPGAALAQLTAVLVTLETGPGGQTGEAAAFGGAATTAGFQLVVPSVKVTAAAPAVGRAVFAQRAVQEQREEYLLSIGRIFHRVLLCGSAINVTHYRPRHPYPVKRHRYRYRAQCHHHPSYVLCQAELSTDRPESYNWNFLDNYVCTKGGVDFQLTPSLKYWRCRFLLVPSLPACRDPSHPAGAAPDHRTVVDNFIKFISAVTFALNRFKRHQPTTARPQIRERLPSNRMDQRSRARSGSSVSKAGIRPAVPTASNSAEDVSTGTCGGPPSSGTLLTRTAPPTEVSEALRSPDTGLPFLTRCVHGGLPEFTFIAADLVQWVYQHVAGLSSEAEAVAYCKELWNAGLILHASRDAKKPFMNGFCLFCLTSPADGPQLSSAAHQEQFSDYWLEVESQFSWPPPAPVGSRLFSPALPPDDAHGVSEMRRGALSLDVSSKSDRAEWGEISYESSFRPDRAYQFCINWLVGTGSLISDLVVGWQRRAHNFGLRLFPVPAVMCPGDQGDIDPLRIAVPVPIALDQLRRPGRPLFDGFDPATWPERLLLLQTAILEQFSFVRVRGPRPEPPYQFVHSHGHCFVQILEPEFGEDGDPVKADLQWLNNSLMSRRWRVGDDSADRLMAELTAFCRNDDDRLVLFWRQAHTEALLQQPTPPP